MKLLHAIGASTLFIALLSLTYAGHIHLFRVDVIFYAAIADTAIATSIAAAFLFMPLFKSLGGFEKGLLLVIWIQIRSCDCSNWGED